MSTNIQTKLARNAATANAIRVLLDEFEGGEFTSREGKALLRKHREGAQFDNLNDNNWFKVSRVEYFDLPESVEPCSYRIWFADGSSSLTRDDYSRYVGRKIWFDRHYRAVSAFEKLDAPVAQQGKRYYYTVREDYAEKMAREFVREEDIEKAMRKIQRKFAELEADYESLKALKAMHFDSED